METVLTVLIVIVSWIVLSIPLGILVGKFIKNGK